MGVNRQTIINWGKDGTLKLKGMGKASRSFWVDEEVIAAITDTAAEVEQAQQQFKAMRDELNELTGIMKEKVRKTKCEMSIIGTLSRRLSTVPFFKSFTWAMSFLGVINVREEEVINRVLDGASLDEIGDYFCLSRERILQIFLKACRKCGQHGNLKQYIANSEDTKKELEQLRLDNEGLKRALSQWLKEKEELHETYGPIYDEELARLEELTRKLDVRIFDCDLSVRTLNCLKASDIDTVGDICRYGKTDLLKMRNFGKKSLTEVDDFIEAQGLEFRMDVDGIYQKRAELRLLYMKEHGDELEKQTQEP